MVLNPSVVATEPIFWMEVRHVNPIEDMETIYRTYHKRVYRQCFRMVRNHDDAEDLTQEVFLRVSQKASTFRGESLFSTWLHRLTFNLVLMELRRERRRPASAFSLATSPGSEENNLGAMEVEKTLQVSSKSIVERVILDTALAELPSGYRRIFVLHDAQGYGHGEIARLLGISAGTSKSQLHKARYRLRALLGNDLRKSSPGRHAASARRRSRDGKDLPRLRFAAA
jgi:RNA polymerase sigma-70 factor (ECF subfamily)